jgi:hypothetical protein
LEIYIGIVAGIPKLVKNVSDSRHKITITAIKGGFMDLSFLDTTGGVIMENLGKTGLFRSEISQELSV